MRYFSSSINRTLCDVLDEMRKCYETRNFSYLMGLIEEAQHMGSSMEAALYDNKDWKRSRKELKKLEEEIKKLEEKKDALQEDK